MGHGELCTLAFPGTCKDALFLEQAQERPRLGICCFSIVLRLSLRKARGPAEAEDREEGKCATNVGPDPKRPRSHLGPHSSFLLNMVFDQTGKALYLRRNWKSGSRKS